MEDSDITAREPVIVKRIQSKFTIDRRKYFEWIESIMESLPSTECDSVSVAMHPYIETRVAEDPNLDLDFFNIIKMGYLYMGIGSALDLKYLVRIRGKTDDPYDDVVLEIEEVRNLSEISCIQFGVGNDPFRIVLGQARIAYQSFHHLGYFRFRNINFWVQFWVDNYREVTICEGFNSQNFTILKIFLLTFTLKMIKIKKWMH